MTESDTPTQRAKGRPGRRPGGGRPRGDRGRSQAPLVELGTITTPPELILFNAYLAAEKDLERHRQRVRAAEIAREKAAAKLRELKGSSAGRDEVDAAEKEWREALENLKRVEAGEEPEPAATDDTGAAAPEAADGTDTDAADGEAEVEALNSETSPGDAPSDDAPVADAGLGDEAAADAGGDTPPEPSDES